MHRIPFNTFICLLWGKRPEGHSGMRTRWYPQGIVPAHRRWWFLLPASHIPLCIGSLTWWRWCQNSAACNRTGWRDLRRWEMPCGMQDLLHSAKVFVSGMLWYRHQKGRSRDLDILRLSKVNGNLWYVSNLMEIWCFPKSDISCHYANIRNYLYMLCVSQ